MTLLEQILTPEVVGLITAVIVALLAYVVKLLGDLTQKAKENGQAIQAAAVTTAATAATVKSMDTAQTVQMIAAQPAQLVTATPIRSTYRKMTDAVKADTCNDISLADQQSFLAQVQFNEDVGNERYTVSLSKGFLIIENGMVNNDSMPPLKEG